MTCGVIPISFTAGKLVIAKDYAVECQILLQKLHSKLKYSQFSVNPILQLVKKNKFAKFPCDHLISPLANTERAIFIVFFFAFEFLQHNAMCVLTSAHYTQLSAQWGLCVYEMGNESVCASVFVCV